ncbi:hypothetical protein WJX81_005649 [Elliptochloris bilobata]|uniref:RRM domain-containing protein n=1 Tax=Elliptochloris bilobata TaxID=381761 RepID=A0AAW1RQN6_9CHLO
MAAGEGLAHSNLFVKSQLLSQPDFDEAALTTIFSPYGHIDSCRLVIKPKHSIAFVRFSSINEAEAALSLNNTQVNGFSLEVKLADADAGPPAVGFGQTASDNLYVRGLDTGWTEADLSRLFSTYGNVKEVRLLQGDETRGVGGLVRMGTVEEAGRAVEALGKPHAGGGAMVVRYADSPEEKLRKLAKKAERARYAPFMAGGSPHAGLPIGFAEFDAAGMQDTGAMHAMQGRAGYADARMGQGMAAGGYAIAGGYALPARGATQLPPGGPGSCHVGNMPPDADKLYLYERFAPHGAIVSVKVLRDEQDRCKGGFVNFANRVSAQSAIASLHSTPSGVPGESLAVSLQARRQHRPSPQPAPTPPPGPLP